VERTANTEFGGVFCDAVYLGLAIEKQCDKKMVMNKFDRSKHVYSSPDFEEIVNDTIRFFNGTPVHSVPAPEKFSGTGVYAIYCIAKTGLYKKFHTINRTAFNLPIYVGKAVPKGWRQARQYASNSVTSNELHHRIKEHARSIELGSGRKVTSLVLLKRR